MQASNDIENLTKREIKIRIAVDSLLTHFGFLRTSSRSARCRLVFVSIFVALVWFA